MQLFIRDKCGLSWALLHNKALLFAKQLVFGDEFKASNGWLTSVLKDANKKFVLALHGEGMGMSPEEQQENKEVSCSSYIHNGETLSSL